MTLFLSPGSGPPYSVQWGASQDRAAYQRSTANYSVDTWQFKWFLRAKIPAFINYSVLRLVGERGLRGANPWSALPTTRSLTWLLYGKLKDKSSRLLWACWCRTTPFCSRHVAHMQQSPYLRPVASVHRGIDNRPSNSDDINAQHLYGTQRNEATPPQRMTNFSHSTEKDSATGAQFYHNVSRRWGPGHLLVAPDTSSSPWTPWGICWSTLYQISYRFRPPDCITRDVRA